MATKNGTTVLVVSALAAGAAFAITRDYRSTPFDALFEKAAAVRGLNPNLLRAITKRENKPFDPRAIGQPNRNGTRDYGLMQINETTAKALGITDPRALLDPTLNVNTAARLLIMVRNELGKLFSTETLVSAYNAGSPAVLKAGGVPPNPLYVAEVMMHLFLYEIGGLFK